LDNQYLLLKLAALFSLRPDKKILDSSVAAGATQNDSDLGFFVYTRDLHDVFQLYLFNCERRRKVSPNRVFSHSFCGAFFRRFSAAAPGFQQPSFFMALILQ